MAFESIVIVQVWLVTEIGFGICRCGASARSSAMSLKVFNVIVFDMLMLVNAYTWHTSLVVVPSSYGNLSVATTHLNNQEVIRLKRIGTNQIDSDACVRCRWLYSHLQPAILVN